MQRIIAEGAATYAPNVEKDIRDDVVDVKTVAQGILGREVAFQNLKRNYQFTFKAIACMHRPVQTLS